jgi:predicted lactoylglutathione lyase
MGAADYRAHLGTRGPIVIWLNMSSRAEVDALHDRWLAAGAKLDHPPAAKPYRLYEFLAFDADGNVLRVFYDFAWEEREA